MTVLGTIANIPIVCLFTALPYVVLAAKVKKIGTFLVMGILNVLPGLMVGNILGIALSIVGWALAEVVATAGRYRSNGMLVGAYVVGCVGQSAGFTFPMYYASEQYLMQRQAMLHLSDALLKQYLSYLSWPVWGAMVGLTAITATLGGLIALKVLRKHFVKASLVAK